MDAQQILALFDKEQRQEVLYSDTRREVTPPVIRHLSRYTPDGSIIYTWLTPANIDTTIRDQIDYFENLGHDFEWKVYSHDQPADLKDRLTAHGFEIEEPEALVVLDLEKAPATLWQPIMADVRRITDPDKLSDVSSVEEQVWQEDFSWLARRMADDLRQNSEHLSVYVGYMDGVAASAAWIYFHAGSQFASLWGGSTLPAFRKRGLYSALLATRAQEARRRGVRFLTVDASPMSRPILEAFGFQWLSTIYPCKWRAKRNADVAE